MFAPFGAQELLRNGLENLLTHSLGLTAGDSLAFIHDAHYRALLAPLEKMLGEIGVQWTPIEIVYDGIQPPAPEVANIILGPDNQTILFGLVHNIWHTPERKKAKYSLGKRLASLVCAPEDLATGGSMVEIERLSALARSVSLLFRRGATFRASTTAGTDFTAVVETPFCEDGKYDQKGKGGDFPSGEVGFGPRSGSVNGMIVYDLKVQHIGVLQSSLFLEVRNDEVVRISGRHADDFRQICRDRGDILKYISEVSLGMNPAGTLSLNPQFIPEEKQFGTMHCGHGGNASYGSRTGAHIDGVMKCPTVRLDRTIVMENGRIAPNQISPELVTWLNQYS